MQVELAFELAHSSINDGQHVHGYLYMATREDQRVFYNKTIYRDREVLK